MKMNIYKPQSKFFVQVSFREIDIIKVFLIFDVFL